MLSSVHLPDILINSDDYNRVLLLAEGVSRRMPYVAEYLERELTRAELCHPWERAGVSMGDNVLFRLDDEPQVRMGRLSYPNTLPLGRRSSVPILSPVGAALIGMHEGSSIEWLDGERTRVLTVLSYGF